MTEAARARVARLLALAPRLADAADPLGREARAALLATSGLTPEGIDLALREHLEQAPSPADLVALLAGASPAPRCHVVLSANVCTAALRALACALATAPVVCVRPSRRDPVLASILVRELAKDPDFAGSITLVDNIAPEPGDAVHLYGSDEALAAITAGLPAGAVVHAHGTGLGVAVLCAGEGIEAAADSLARDVVAFDQRGCLSPRAALVEGDADRADALAAALHRSLTDLGARVPRGPLDPDTAAELTRYRTTVEAIGTLRIGPNHMVGVDPDPRALLLPPPARVLHVVPASVANIEALLGPWAPYLTVIGGAGALADAAHALAPRARRAPLGGMQRPPLDGPVDLRPASVAAKAGLQSP